ncbi:hypothetical protein GPA19_05380 [Azoarcus indigens]|uniref:Uncharacterized protein n=1 Tax=Azoarcus indigens TaxID=29545 RepID=A0A4R6DWZ9_9RHOO|nr:hypothetical protein [Azoarcus indigens]NMG64377.1 hypothetical protein [Azoarcus indigens]TDN49169.1 hypothetical protein C7389_11220 [Azoarcus indigens]
MAVGSVDPVDEHALSSRPLTLQTIRIRTSVSDDRISALRGKAAAVCGGNGPALLTSRKLARLSKGGRGALGCSLKSIGTAGFSLAICQLISQHAAQAAAANEGEKADHQ